MKENKIFSSLETMLNNLKTEFEKGAINKMLARLQANQILEILSAITDGVVDLYDQDIQIAKKVFKETEEFIHSITPTKKSQTNDI